MAGKVTLGLLFDVQEVLERHGFALPGDERMRHLAHADTALALVALVEAFEGRGASS